MKNSEKIRVIAIVGPTASGKTALSVEVAKSFGGEVISADSMQIYKGMDIATAKPTTEEMQGVKHHMVDFLSPSDEFSVANFVDMAHKAALEINLRGNVPVIAGGTGLYIDNFLSGTKFIEGETDLALRAQLFERLEEEGIDSLLNELKEVDFESYERLKPLRNPKRVVRALEIFKSTGLTMTEQNKLSVPKEKPYEAVKIGLDFKNRQALYDRINYRVDLMAESGLVKEAEDFFSAAASSTAVQAIGYKELEPFFKGEAELESCLDSLKQATRRYAKRQLTWFRRDESTHWFYVDEYKYSAELFSAVKAFLVSKGFDLL